MLECQREMCERSLPFGLTQVALRLENRTRCALQIAHRDSRER